jgi:diguanylate cyclase (GGDEF)-like protein
MSSDAEVGRVVSLVGLGVQTAGAFLLAVLFVLLVRTGERRPYFRAWTVAWMVLAISLGCVGLYFATRSSPADPLRDAILLSLYQAGKAVFFLCLLAGARLFANGRTSLSAARVFILGALVFAVACVLVTRQMRALIAVQALVALPCLVNAVHVMLRLPPVRRGFGVRATAVSLGAFALLWTLYLVMFVARPVDGVGLLGRVSAAMSWYNTYVDLLIQTVLAFGMVLLASEEAHGELAVAHGQLGQAHEELRAETLRDTLTGALNRRAYSELVFLEHALENGGSVVVVDFDDFKDVNDRHGHDAGDALLRHFVRELRERLRESDLLYRLGGDEFLVIVPGAVPERLQARFADNLAGIPPLVLPEGGVELPLKVSWGMAEFQDAEDLSRAVREADARMYEGKRAKAPAAATA